MKFLHTADWQIGMQASHVGAVAEQVRRERMAAAERAVDVARREEVDFVLLAGDTFEDNGIDRLLVQQVADTLARFDGPVFLLPGNHDPLVPGSVWEHAAWGGCENLRVLGRAEPIEVAGGRLYPCPVFEKHGTEDPTRWIEAADDTIAVGMAHGSVEGIPQERAELPIPRAAAEQLGLDYLALGHWHSTHDYDGRMAYSGTHETTRFDERDSGNVLVVEIAARGSMPRITPIRTGGLTWMTLPEEIHVEGDLARVRQRIESIEDGQRTLLDVRLGGMLHAAEQAELARIEEIAGSRFLFHRIENRLRAAATDGRWVDELPQGILRETARRLQCWADDDECRNGPPAEVAQQALLQLHALYGGGHA